MSIEEIIEGTNKTFCFGALFRTGRIVGDDGLLPLLSRGLSVGERISPASALLRIPAPTQTVGR